MPSAARNPILASAAAAALMLTACGSSDRQTPTLDLPLEAPAGASNVVADFVELCSLVMIDQSAAITAISQRDRWKAPSGSILDEAVAFGGFVSEGENGESFQIFSLDFPHVEGVSCQIVGSLPDQHPDLSALADLPGMLGAYQTVGTGDDVSQIGRFSGIGPDGYPVTLQVVSNPNLFFTLAMTSTRPVKPSASNPE